MASIKVDGYQVHEEIGRGGSGVVYRALELDTEREVAIKVIEQGQINDPEFIRHFHTEAQFVARLEHPHIVPLYNYRREPGRVYLVMRYLRGRSLRDLLFEKGYLELAQTAQMLDQISLALAYAHKRNIVHRDIKPGNILLDEDGNFYLTDFGIAIHVRGIEIGGIGSPDYAAPGQWRGEPATPQSDIYSLGITLYETLAGKNPFHTVTPSKLMERHFHELVPLLSQVNPSLHQEVDLVIQRATAKEESDRYPDTVSMALDFHRIVAVTEKNHSYTQLNTLSSDIPQSHNSVPLTENPYKGLEAFKETDAVDFFGREMLTNQLIMRLSQRTDTHRFLAIVGASGSGKSSLVYAGLFPALRKGALPEATNWFITSMTPGATPFEELESALRRVAVKSTSGLAEQMHGNTQGLLKAAEQILPDDGSELLLFIDQFEELYTLLDSEDERTEFLDNLVVAVRDPHTRIRLIIALRADFYDRPLLYAPFANLLRYHTEVIVPLTKEEVRDTITKPAQRVNLTFDDGLLNAIISDVGNQPGSLPLLQYTMTELYKQRTGHRLTLDTYITNGSLLGILTHRADEIYSQLSAEQREIARQLFLRLVVFGAGLEATRQRVKRSELTALMLRSEKASIWNKSDISLVLDIFNRHRLLTFDYDPVTHNPTVEIAHEILIRGWSRLADWLNANRENLLIHRHLTTTVREWVKAERDPSYLAIGTRLSQLETLKDESDLALNDDELAYLDASIAERQHQKTERDNQHRRLTRLQNSIIAILAIFLVVSVLLSILVFNSRDDALSAANIAFARQLAAQAIAELRKPVGNNEFAALLAIRSLNIRYDPISDQALVEAASKLPLRIFSGHTGRIYSVAYAPDGKYVVTGSADHTAKLWDVTTGHEVRTFSGHTDEIYSVAYAPDGKYVVTGSADHTAKLWDVKTGHEVRTFSGHDLDIWSVAFSPDSQYIVTGSDDNTGKVWDIATGKAIHLFGCNDSAPESVSFSPDGKSIAVGCADYSIKVLDASNGQEIHHFQGHNGGIYAITFSPDSKYILTGSLDNTAKLWDAATGQEVRTFSGHSNSVRGVAFSLDGKFVFTASRDYTAKLWNAATGQEVRTFSGHSAGLYAIALSPDGKYLVTGSADTTAKLWEVSTDRTLNIFRGHDAEVYGTAFSPDGKYVLTGSVDHTAKLWDVTTGQEIRTFRGHNAEVWSVAYSSDGKSILTGSTDHTAKLWDVATGEEIRTFRGHTADVRSVAFSPNGRYIVTGSDDHTSKIWDTSTGKEIRTLIGNSDIVQSAVFSPDGKYVLTAGADIILWETSTGREIRSFVDHSITNYGVAFSMDGRYVLTGNEDGTAQLWETSTGQEIRSFVGHTHAIYGVAFSPDGKYILTASADRTAKLWDVTTGESIRTLSGHDDAVWSVAFSPDGTHILTGSLDSTARLWDTDYRDFIATICSRLLRDFTDIEREQVPISDKEPTCPIFSSQKALMGIQ